MDKIFPLSIARKLQEIAPAATLKVLEGVGHSPPEEAPDQTAEEILAFARADSAGAGVAAAG